MWHCLESSGRRSRSLQKAEQFTDGDFPHVRDILCYLHVNSIKLGLLDRLLVNTVELQWLEVYHGYFELVLVSLNFFQ